LAALVSLPATATTLKTCVPVDRAGYRRGEEHGAAKPSSVQRKPVFERFAVNEIVATVCSTLPDGADVIVTSSGVGAARPIV
jgi:hypothetical protein